VIAPDKSAYFVDETAATGREEAFRGYMILSGFEVEATLGGTSLRQRVSEPERLRHHRCMAGKRFAKGNHPPTMENPKRTLSVLALLLYCGVTVDLYAQAAIERVVILPDQLEWKVEPFSPYPDTAILFGDPAKPGIYVIRVKLPAGFKIMPHVHPDEWRTTSVLSGTQYFALGAKWDETELKPYPAGTFFIEPKGTPHFVWAKDGEVILQITGIGPTSTTMIPQN
jgi:quercetin dioxygenase-like cupin family protein